MILKEAIKTTTINKQTNSENNSGNVHFKLVSLPPVEF